MGLKTVKMALGDELVVAGDPSEEEEEAEAEEEEEEAEEEEMVDPQDTKKESCAAECSSYKAKLDACNDRVSGAEGSEETCEEELFDFLHCVDSCVSKGLFNQLK